MSHEGVSKVSEDKGGVVVEIFGSQYRVRGDGDSEEIREIARYVDGKMKEIASKTPVGSLTSIAILAALNIAEELFRVRDERENFLREIDLVTTRMQRKLEEIASD